MLEKLVLEKIHLNAEEKFLLLEYVCILLEDWGSPTQTYSLVLNTN